MSALTRSVCRTSSSRWRPLSRSALSLSARRAWWSRSSACAVRAGVPGLAQQLWQLAAQPRQRRLPVVGAIAGRLELLQQLDQAALEVVGPAVAQARHEPLHDPAAQAEGDVDDELGACPLGLGRHRTRRRVDAVLGRRRDGGRLDGAGVARQAAARAAADVDRRDRDRVRQPLRAQDHVDQALQGPLAGLEQRIAHGGERWDVGGGLGRVVEPDDRHVLGDAQACLGERAHRPESREVVAREHRRERTPAREDLLHGLVTATLAVPARLDERLVGIEPQTLAQPAKRVETREAVAGVERVAGDVRDAAVAVRAQVSERVPEAHLAVGQHRGRAVAGADEDDREAVRLQLARVRAPLFDAQRGDEQQPIRVPRADRNEVRVLGHDRPRGARGRRIVDRLADPAGEEHVAAERAGGVADAEEQRLQEPVRRRPLVELPAREDADRRALPPRGLGARRLRRAARHQSRFAGGAGAGIWKRESSITGSISIRSIVRVWRSARPWTPLSMVCGQIRPPTSS